MLSIQNISKSFGDVHALKNVSLDLKPGLFHSSANVATYSGGMRQRFGVAQAMLGDPKVLIVDEPTAGLDPAERQRFLDLLSEQAETKIIILSTHIIEDVRDLCTDMAVMGQGQVVARGAPEDLISRVKGKVWRKKLNKETANTIKSRENFLSSRHLSGGVIVSILSNEYPGDGWEEANEVLEDAYHAHLNGLVDETGLKLNTVEAFGA